MKVADVDSVDARCAPAVHKAIQPFSRLFAYGALSVALVIYLTGLGLTEAQTGALLTLTLLCDTAISLWLTTRCV